MLNLNVKKLLVREMPSTLTIDGHVFTINRTLGSTPLNNLSLPTVNLKFIGEGTPWYRSFDDEHTMNDTYNVFKHIYVCTLRYTVAAADTTISDTQSIKYLSGINTYAIARVPVKDITNIATFDKNVDYRLSLDRESVEWIDHTPAVNSNFTVEYDWIDSGLYISHQLIDYLMKDVHGRVFDLLRPYGIDVIDSKSVIDLSEIYANDALSAFSFDIIITYPYTWTTTLADEYLADSVALSLLLENLDSDTLVETVDIDVSVT